MEENILARNNVEDGLRTQTTALKKKLLHQIRLSTVHRVAYHHGRAHGCTHTLIETLVEALIEPTKTSIARHPVRVSSIHTLRLGRNGRQGASFDVIHSVMLVVFMEIYLDTTLDLAAGQPAD